MVKISYISSNLIYLSHGKNVGLLLGTHVEVFRQDQQIATLKIVHLSEKSSACEVVSKKEPVQVGDIIHWERESQVTIAQDPIEPPEQSEPISGELSPKTPKTAPKNRFRGTLGFQWFQFTDDSDFGRDYQQPSLRLNIKGRELFGNHFGITLRTRTRRRSGIRSQEKNYQNRIYQAAIHYNNPKSRFNFSLGRIISNTFSGAGYLDGALVEAKLGSGWSAGLFGGYQPDWRESDLQTNHTKYGSYINFRRGEIPSGLWSSTLGWSSAFRESEIDREFIFVQNRFSKGSKFHFYQSAEIDINRGWRKDRAGSEYEVSNLYAYARYQFTSKFRMGLNFDNRQNYYTYELLNQDEQFFDELARQGYRLDMHARVTQRFQLSGYAGKSERKQSTEQSDFQNLRIFWRPKHLFGISLGLTLSAFDTPLNDGENWQLRLGRYFGNGRNALHLSVADYQYTTQDTGAQRESQWLRLETYTSFGKKWYFTSQWEQNQGDDLNGLRILILLGYRL